MRFVGVPAGMKPNRPPSEGLQFFGRVSIDAASRAMTVEHWNVAGEVLWSTRLDAVT
jgi:alkaline phosphatase D